MGGKIVPRVFPKKFGLVSDDRFAVENGLGDAPGVNLGANNLIIINIFNNLVIHHKHTKTRYYMKRS